MKNQSGFLCFDGSRVWSPCFSNVSMTQLCLRKLDLNRIIFAHLHRLWDWKVLANPILKSIFSDLKGPFCILVMRIKYCISPKSYYTVMNIPLHCQEPGGDALWCLPYWRANILLKASVWTRSQEAWIFSCGALKPCGSSWAAATPVIPYQCRSPFTPHQVGNCRFSLSFKRCPSTYRMRLRSDIRGSFAADVTVHVQEPGLQHFLSSIRTLHHLGPTCYFDPCPPSGNFYQQPQEAEEFSFNGHTGICQSYQVCIFFPHFHISGRSQIKAQTF